MLSGQVLNDGKMGRVKVEPVSALVESLVEALTTQEATL